MKIAKVIPIFKNEDQTSFCDNRPISLLPVISKVIEKVIYNQMYSVFTKHQLFNDNQYEFKSGHSTEHAILEVIDRTIAALDSNETPIKVKKRQQFSVMHLKEFTLANHLHLQSNFSP